MLAKAVKAEVGPDAFFSISPSKLLSKYVGESEANVTATFADAKAHKPAVIFFDEADSLFSKRDSTMQDHERRLKAELLVQLDGAESENDGILVIAATNTPWDLDPAFRRRFKKRVYIPMPDDKARRELFEVMLKEVPNDLQPDDLEWLATTTDGYSSDDIHTFIENADEVSIDKFEEATHFKLACTSPSCLWIPCDPNDEGATEKDRIKVGKIPPPITRQDFEKALLDTSPSVDPSSLKAFEDFTKNHGLRG